MPSTSLINFFRNKGYFTHFKIFFKSHAPFAGQMRQCYNGGKPISRGIIMDPLYFAVNLLGFLGLIFTIYRGLRSHQEKRVTTWLVITRLIILLLVGLTIVDQLHSLPAFNPLSIIRGVYLIFLFVVSEVTFGRKQESFGSPHQMMRLELLTLTGILVLPW
ncbi:hypothetical protein HC019_01725 [Limosilactobacillus fermentum]|nr:hypothetical protein [Limosilactobacillus fermentum]PHI34375.1 hypothetical protein CEW18_00670 [Limosilactobacillus fermentum]